MNEQPYSGPPEFRLDQETRDDVLEVLADLAQWRLPPPRWEHVRGAIDALGEALANGDALAVREAIDEVEQLGPVRATRIGTADRAPAPARVLDRVNALVHSLGEDSAAPAADEREQAPG